VHLYNQRSRLPRCKKAQDARDSGTLRGMMRWRLRSVLLTLFVVVTALGAACMSRDATPRETPPSATLEPPPVTANPAPSATATAASGIASVNAAVAAVEAGDVDAMMELVTYTKLPCVAPEEAQQLEGRPLCRIGESTGDLVDGFVVAQCEGGTIRRGDSGAIRQALDIYLSGSPRFYGAYATRPEVWGAGKYIAIFFGAPGISGGASVALLDDAGIVGAATGCGASPEQLGASQTPLRVNATQTP